MCISSSGTAQTLKTSVWQIWPYTSAVNKMWDHCSSWACHGTGVPQHLHPSIPSPTPTALDAPITHVMRLPLYEWVDFDVQKRKSCVFGKFQCSQWALSVNKLVLFKYQTVIAGRCSHVQNATRSQDLFWSKEIMGCLHQVDKDKF